MAQKMAEIYEKFVNGDSLSDEELKVGAIFFHDMWVQLKQAGPVFKLAANEANRVQSQFDSFIRARNEHANEKTKNKLHGN